MATSLSKKVLALVAAGASAATIATQFIGEKEGNRFTSYQDAGGVWTACEGVTKNVLPHHTYTAAECAKMNADAINQAAQEVQKMVKVPLTEPERAAVISFCAYNIGPGKCASSTFLKQLNAGDRAGPCAQIKRWIFDGGRDCRERSNNCYGQVIRRQQEHDLCLMN